MYLHHTMHDESLTHHYVCGKIRALIPRASFSAYWYLKQSGNSMTFLNTKLVKIFFKCLYQN